MGLYLKFVTQGQTLYYLHFKSLMRVAVIGLLTINLACSGEIVSNLRSIDSASEDGTEDISPPQRITGAFLATIDNAIPRCTFAYLNGLTFKVACQTTISDKSGNEIAAQGYVSDLVAEWQEPIQLGHLSNIKSVSCEVSQYSLRFDCEISLNKMELTELEVRLKLKTKGKQKYEKDIIVLPYSIASYGVVPEAMRGFAPDALSPSVGSSLRLNGDDKNAEKLGFQLYEMSEYNFGLYRNTYEINNYVKCGDAEFESIGQFVFRIYEGKVVLYAGSSVMTRNEDKAHPLQFYLGSKVESLQCVGGNLIIKSDKKLVKIAENAKHVEILYDTELPGTTKVTEDLKFAFAYDGSQAIVYDIEKKAVIFSKKLAEKTVRNAIRVAMTLPELDHVLVNLEVAPDMRRAFVTVPAKHEVYELSVSNGINILLSKEFGNYKWSGNHEIGSNLCFPDELRFQDNFLYLRDFGNSRILKFDLVAKEVMAVLQQAKHSVSYCVDSEPLYFGDYRLYESGLAQFFRSDSVLPRPTPMPVPVPIDHFGPISLKPLLLANDDILLYDKKFKMIKNNKVDFYEPMNKTSYPYASYAPVFVGAAGEKIFYSLGRKIFARSLLDGSETRLNSSSSVDENFPRPGLPLAKLSFEGHYFIWSVDKSGSIYLIGDDAMGGSGLYKTNSAGQLVAVLGTSEHYPIQIDQDTLWEWYVPDVVKIQDSGDIIIAKSYQDYDASPNLYYTDPSLVRYKLQVVKINMQTKKWEELLDVSRPEEMSLLEVSNKGDIFIKEGKNSIPIKKVVIASKDSYSLKDTLWKAYDNADCGSNIILEGLTSQSEKNSQLEADLSKICMGSVFSLTVEDECSSKGIKRWLINHSIAGQRSTLVHVNEPCK